MNGEQSIENSINPERSDSENIDFIKETSQELREKIINLRRTIHQNPELGFEEYETAKLVVNELKNLGIETYEGIGKTGVVGIIRGKSSEKAVLLRADMDALPVQESTNLEYKSNKDGISHACGHDAHVAALLGSAEILKRISEQNGLNGDVIVAFQPNEERTVEKSGAMEIIKFLSKNDFWHKIEGVYACHVAANTVRDTIKLKEGVFLAGSGKFDIQIKSPGGHGARVHEVPNPVVLGSGIIKNIAAEFGGLEPESELRETVVSPTIVHSGGGKREAKNIISPELDVGGTVRIRTQDSKKTWMQLQGRVKEIINEILDPWKEKGADYEIGFTPGTRPVI
ncbi:MAG: amidohydrolase [Patescibacteria group bacterium]